MRAVKSWNYVQSDLDNPPRKENTGSPPVFPWTQALLTPAVRAVQPQNIGPGDCNEGFLRPDALLHVVIVSDETEQGRDWLYDIDDARTFRPAWELALESLVAAKGGRADMVEVSGFTDHQPHLQHEPRPTCTGVPASCQSTVRQAPGTQEPDCDDGFTAIRQDCFTVDDAACAADSNCEVHPSTPIRRSRCDTETRFQGIVQNQQGNYRCCASGDTSDTAAHGDCVSAFAAAADDSVQSCPMGCHYTHNGNALDGCVCNLGDVHRGTRGVTAGFEAQLTTTCLLYTSDAADE